MYAAGFRGGEWLGASWDKQVNLPESLQTGGSSTVLLAMPPAAFAIRMVPNGDTHSRH